MNLTLIYVISNNKLPKKLGSNFKVKNRRSRPFKRLNNRNNDNFANGNNNTRVRGNLSTVLEKYKVLAKDAAASGDHIGAENYMQHAEHYSRLLNERQDRYNEKMVQ